VTDQPANETETLEEEWERPTLFAFEMTDVIQNGSASNFDGTGSS
jgi:hypothetical protein